jgi:hypothetical protein
LSTPLAQLAIGAREVVGDADVDEIAAIGRAAQLAACSKAGKHVLLERGGKPRDVSENGLVDDVDAGIDRTRGARARRDEIPHEFAVQRDTPVAVADDAVA